MTGGDGRYSVKFDANRDGELDTVYFDNQKTANLFSECFVNNSQKSACIGWMYEQAMNTTFPGDVSGVQLYKNGKRFEKEINPSWIWGIDGLKESVARLWKNIVNDPLANRIEIYSSIAKLATGLTTENEAKVQIKKILTTANKPDSSQKLNEAQINLLVDMLWNHRFSLFGVDNEFTVRAAFPVDFVKTAVDAVDEKIFSSCEPAEDGTYQSGCADYPDLNLAGAEIMEVHRLFGYFDMESALSTETPVFK